MYSDLVENIVRLLPPAARAAARQNLPHLIDALEAEGILTPRILSYALATVGHETAGRWAPVREGLSDAVGRREARKRNYQGGEDWYGRGFIQLTHKNNYEKMDEALGMGGELVKNPDILVTNPDVSAKVFARYLKDSGAARLAESGNFVAARTPVNPDKAGRSIATASQKFLGAIGNKLSSLPEVRQEQQQSTQEVLTPIPSPALVPTPIQRALTGARPAETTTRFAALPSARTGTITAGVTKTKTLSPQVSSATAVRGQPVTIASRPPNPVVNSMPAVTYVVKRGDTPSGIAQKLGIGASNWRQVWGGDPRRMPAGAVLKIPTPGRARYG